jgi:hypothetical protein
VEVGARVRGPRLVPALPCPPAPGLNPWAYAGRLTAKTKQFGGTGGSAPYIGPSGPHTPGLLAYGSRSNPDDLARLGVVGAEPQVAASQPVGVTR